MKLYRFSPIKTKEELFTAITHIHFGMYALCKESFGHPLPNTGMVGIFCHYDEEYDLLRSIQSELTNPSQSINGKYLKLYEPFVIEAKDGILQTTYTHLYIRKPDPYRSHVGDADLYLEPKNYTALKNSLLSRRHIKGARIYANSDIDMVELYDPDIDVLSYVSSNNKPEHVFVKEAKSAALT